jgi:hypothetical protein
MKLCEGRIKGQCVVLSLKSLYISLSSRNLSIGNDQLAIYGSLVVHATSRHCIPPRVLSIALTTY